MTKGKKITVLIGDRQPIFRSGLHRLLSRDPGIVVIGEAEDSQQALAMTGKLKPEILLLDALLVEINGPEILDELHQKHKQVKVILLTPSEKEEDSVKVLRARTACILSKQAPVDMLIKCIRRAHAGEPCLDPVKEEVAAGDGTSKVSPSGGPARDSSPLSFREKQVVSLVSQGYKNKEIAESMFISEQTVKNHLHNIFDKLGVSDRLELALYAIHKNLQKAE